MYKGNILVVEDEERLRKLVVKYLIKEDFTVFEAEDGKQALEMWEIEIIDLIILDVMMPEIDGWTVCRRIRETSNVPIIMLTARGEERDKIFGFELGIDQYVTKPFSTKELVARVKSLLKRKGKITAEERIDIGEISIHLKSRLVTFKGEEIDLSPKEYDLLLYFADNKNIALSREMILDRVWGYDYFGDYRTVDTHVKRLRKKLKEGGNYIITLRGVGYRFEVKV